MEIQACSRIPALATVQPLKNLRLENKGYQTPANSERSLCRGSLKVDPAGIRVCAETGAPVSIGISFWRSLRGTPGPANYIYADQ